MSKATKRKRSYYHDPLMDNRGFPDMQDHYESLLPDPQAGTLLRKRVHSAPKLDDIDPTFGEPYDESLHGDTLRAELDIAHLEPAQQDALTSLIKKYW